MDSSDLDVRIASLAADDIDDLEHLWLALDSQHRLIGPRWAAVWEPPVTWAIRKERYRAWLAEPDAFALGAYQAGTLVGYLIAHYLEGPDDTWITGRRIGDIESLAVDPDRRGRGIGSRLLLAARDRMAGIGVTDLWIGVVDGNVDALRFYARHGLRPLMVTVASMPGHQLPIAPGDSSTTFQGDQAVD
jgi:GNAT superfamily N-acetyltransferase